VDTRQELVLIDPLDPPAEVARPRHVLVTVFWATSDPLRLCPERWLGKSTHDDLRQSLRPLLDLPAELVFPSHGEPVVEDAKRRLINVLT
jgi:glyoxylase-like metal-dependent hydrolase (beta-lactamase superfamily II)